ncbi:MAG: TonB-dependent receptor plug domain-containing protein, partial [Bacteroidetes bacterium]|nr:TonB-dependent receptor plug domain-containing protein [Bacteroidota bacterium]
MRKLFLQMTGLIYLISLPYFTFSQARDISGRVTDTKGLPVVGASVTVKQSAQGTMTDADGKFKLNVPSGSTLIIGSAGYRAQAFNADDLAAGAQIKLEEDVARLDEVVVTGLATAVKRRNLANAVTTISSKELSGVAPAQTFDAALEGKIPGAYINANTGAPGGGISVKLRGVTSVYGNTQPLYVVDGVFVDNTATSAGLNVVTAALGNGAITSNANGSTQDNPSSRIADLRAEDIESIEILKGASAAAVYGSKAAGGVVIITTKKGKEGKTRVSISQDLGQISVRKLLGVRHYTDANLAKDPAASPSFIQAFKDAESAGLPMHDYEKEVWGNKGFARNTVLSVSGGNAKTNFYFSGSQKDEGGIMKNTGYRNSSLRLNLEHRLTDNIKIGVSSNYINSSADRGL